MPTDIHLDRRVEEFKGQLASNKEIQDILVDEIKQKTIGEIEARLKTMVVEANKNLERLSAYNEIINRIIAAQNKMLKRLQVLEEENDGFKRLKALVVGISLLAATFTVINGVLTIARIWKG